MARRFTIMALVAATAALGVPGMAAAEDGATVTKEAGCVTSDDGTVCATIFEVSNFTTTPSGITSYQATARITTTFVGAGAYGGCITSHTDDLHFSSLERDGQAFVAADRQEIYNSVINCFGETFDCTYFLRAHFANGEIQFSRLESNCPTT
jgi:hypothetical protein